MKDHAVCKFGTAAKSAPCVQRTEGQGLRRVNNTKGENQHNWPHFMVIRFMLIVLTGWTTLPQLALRDMQRQKAFSPHRTMVGSSQQPSHT